MNDLLGAPTPAFDDPLALLRACHERILAQCRTLERLQQHLPSHGCDAQAQQAAQAILRYFDVAGRHHHDDEELDLFPALRASGDSEAHSLIARLLAEHVEMESAWQALRPPLAALAQGLESVPDAGTVARFIALYRAHIALENPHLLPLAARLLNHEQQVSIGRRMAQRRGVEFPS